MMQLKRSERRVSLGHKLIATINSHLVLGEWNCGSGSWCASCVRSGCLLTVTIPGVAPKVKCYTVTISSIQGTHCSSRHIKLPVLDNSIWHINTMIQDFHEYLVSWSRKYSHKLYSFTIKQSLYTSCVHELWW